MYLNSIFAQYDVVANQIIPTFIIVISTLGMLIRVLFQKRTLGRAIQWKKQRKLIVQNIIYFNSLRLFSISLDIFSIL